MELSKEMEQDAAANPSGAAISAGGRVDIQNYVAHIVNERCFPSPSGVPLVKVKANPCSSFLAEITTAFSSATQSSEKLEISLVFKRNPDVTSYNRFLVHHSVYQILSSHNPELSSSLQEKAEGMVLDPPRSDSCISLGSGAGSTQTSASKLLRVCEEPTCQERGARKCGLCRAVYYCGTDCQRKHWPVHKITCTPSAAYDEGKVSTTKESSMPVVVPRSAGESLADVLVVLAMQGFIAEASAGASSCRATWHAPALWRLIVNYGTRQGTRCMWQCFLGTNIPRIRQLLSLGADVNAVRPDGRTALHLACQGDNTDIVALLLDASACPLACDSTGLQPLHLACAAGKLEVVELLLKSGVVDLEATDVDGSTALSVACQEGDHVRIVQALLDAGADIDHANALGATPLILATQKRRLRIILTLIQASAKVDAAMHNGATALYISCQEGIVPLVRLLVIEGGADIDKGRAGGSTPLFVACQEGHDKVVTFLIERGANVNSSRADEVTCLMVAANQGHGDIVRQLLQANARRNACTSSGLTALDVARHANQSAVVNLLLRAAGEE